MEMQEFADRLLKLAVVLGRYDAEGAHWSELCTLYEGQGEPVPAKDCERHSDALERLADEFAAAARDVLDVQGVPPL